MPAMLTTFAVVVLVVTAIWHAIAGFWFTFRPGFTIAIYTHERPVNRIAQELLRFLGALNQAVALLAVVLIIWPVAPPWPAFLFFAAANLSQAIVDVRVHRLGLTHKRFTLQVLAGDVVVAALNGVAIVVA